MKGVTAGPVAEIQADFWMVLFHGCHTVQESAIVQWCWPDGGCLLDQEHFAVDAFDVIRSEEMKIMNEKRKQLTGRTKRGG